MLVDLNVMLIQQYVWNAFCRNDMLKNSFIHNCTVMRPAYSSTQSVSLMMTNNNVALFLLANTFWLKYHRCSPFRKMQDPSKSHELTVSHLVHRMALPPPDAAHPKIRVHCYSCKGFFLSRFDAIHGRKMATDDAGCNTPMPFHMVSIYDILHQRLLFLLFFDLNYVNQWVS